MRPSSGRDSPMDRDAFWSLLDASVAPRPSKQLKHLRDALKKRPDDEVATFAAWLRRVVDEIDSPALARAAEIVFDGCSDDGYEYFRLWIVSRGRGTAEAIAADPAALLDHLPVDPDEASFEELASPASDVLEARLGEEEAWDFIDNVADELDRREGEAKRHGPKTFDERALKARIEGDEALRQRRAEETESAEAWFAETQRTQTRSGIPIGARVRHQHRGKGVLKSVQDLGGTEFVTIAFDTGETDVLGLGPGLPELVGL